MWRAGVARFGASGFQEAAETFGGLEAAAAARDRGNALVMLGKYDDAVARYDRALALRPGWADAEANRTAGHASGGEDAARRAAMPVTSAGAPTKIVYDKDKKDEQGPKTKT